MAVTSPSQVVTANAVRLGNSITHHHASYRRRPNQEPIFVVMDAALIVVVMKAELGGVTLRESILYIDIGDPHLLMPGFEGVQTAVSILFQEVEISEVVIDTIRSQISEHSDRRVLVDKNKTTKIATEALDTGSNGYEIEIRA